jgi:DNA-binding XRE family transcriptional regulator
MQNEPHPLAVYREQAGLTQKTLAQRLGCSEWTVIAVENGRRSPSFDLVARIVDASNGALRADDFLAYRVKVSRR